MVEYFGAHLIIKQSTITINVYVNTHLSCVVKYTNKYGIV